MHNEYIYSKNKMTKNFILKVIEIWSFTLSISSPQEKNTFKGYDKAMVKEFFFE